MRRVARASRSSWRSRTRCSAPREIRQATKVAAARNATPPRQATNETGSIPASKANLDSGPSIPNRQAAVMTMTKPAAGGRCGAGIAPMVGRRGRSGSWTTAADRSRVALLPQGQRIRRKRARPASSLCCPTVNESGGSRASTPPARSVAPRSTNPAGSGAPAATSSTPERLASGSLTVGQRSGRQRRSAAASDRIVDCGSPAGDVGPGIGPRRPPRPPRSRVRRPRRAGPRRPVRAVSGSGGSR